MRDMTEKLDREKENEMNCKKYRACLVGVIVIALTCGIFFYMKYEKENRIPAGGTLVKNEEMMGSGQETWA